MNQILYFLLADALSPSILADKKSVFDPFPLEEPPPDIIQDKSFLGEFFYMLIMLGMLIGVVLLASYFLKRLSSTRLESINASSTIKILEQRALSPRSQVYLIEIDDNQYLIAEGPAAITAVPLQKSCIDTKKPV